MADNTNDNKLITLSGLRTFYNNLIERLNSLFYTKNTADSTFAKLSGDNSVNFNAKNLSIGADGLGGSLILNDSAGNECYISYENGSCLVSNDLNKWATIDLASIGQVQVNPYLEIGIDSIAVPNIAMPVVFENFTDNITPLALLSNLRTLTPGTFFALTTAVTISNQRYLPGMYVIGGDSSASFNVQKCANFSKSSIYYCKFTEKFYVWESTGFVVISTVVNGEIDIDGEYTVATAEDINSVIETLNESEDEQGDNNDTEDPENTEEE